MADGRTTIGRRHFVGAGLAATAAAIPPLRDASATAHVGASRLALRVPGLDAALEGATLAQVSDLHLRGGAPHAAALAAVELLRATAPDLIVLTGDQWDHRGAPEELAAWTTLLPAGVPVVAVLGNHEYSATRGDVARCARAHERAGVELLVNRSTRVRVRGGTLTLAGLDDLRHGAPDPAAALRGVADDEPVVVLLHEPEQVDRPDWRPAVRGRPVLAGHTHGGQVRVLGMSPYLPPGCGRFLRGWYDTAHGPLYVSRGVGTGGVDVRIGCPAELPVFTLRRAEVAER